MELEKNRVKSDCKTLEKMRLEAEIEKDMMMSE